MQVGKIEYAPNYGLAPMDANSAARLAVEGLSEKPIQISDSVPVTTQLERLPAGIVYLGSPYSKQPDFDEAAAMAEQAAGRLMRRGLAVYCPIAHGHTIAAHGLPTHWDFWKRQCDPFIDAASSLVVLKLDGWRDSVGLTYEIARFHEAGKPIVYVTMEELG